MVNNLGNMRIDRNIFGRLAPLCVVFCTTFLVALCASSAFLPAVGSLASSGSSVSVSVGGAIALSMRDSRDIELSNSHLAIPIIPDADGSLGTADLVADVATNNLTGYTLTMNSQTEETALVHTTGGGSIASTGATLASPAVLAPNHWGYYRWEDGRVDTPTTFSRIPGTTPDTLRVTAAAAASSSTTLSFGASVDIGQEQGSYRQTMVLSVVANYVPFPPPPEPDPANPSTYGAMQQMSNSACTTTRGTAFDARNGQKYYVQRIGDLCYMESNLRYAGDGSWNAAWGYADDRYATSASNNTANASDDSKPLATTSSGFLGGSEVTQWQTPGYFDPGGSTDYTNTTPNGGFYGYLYNWCATMLAQPSACDYTSFSGIDATQSICPAGWRMPTVAEYQIFGSNPALRDDFLAVYSGQYYNWPLATGQYGWAWTSDIVPSGGRDAYALSLGGSFGIENLKKYLGVAVRCVKAQATPLVDGMYIQNVTSKMCSDTMLGATVNLIDQRDGKYYRVRKMADYRCWMIDNLAYSLLQGDTGTTPNTGAPAYSPAAQIVSSNATSVDTQAQYVLNNNVAGQGQIPNNGSPVPSYLYNWCAAMGDTSTNCSTTRAYTTGQPTTPVTGICPAPFRLPIGGAGATIPGNGSNQATAASSTTNEFAKLDIWLGGTGVNRGDANTFTAFTTDSATNSQLFWLGAFGGSYHNGAIDYQGSTGTWQSSSSIHNLTLYFGTNYAGVNPANGGGNLSGFSVRCLL